MATMEWVLTAGVGTEVTERKIFASKAEAATAFGYTPAGLCQACDCGEPCDPELILEAIKRNGYAAASNPLTKAWVKLTKKNSDHDTSGALLVNGENEDWFGVDDLAAIGISQADVDHLLPVVVTKALTGNPKGTMFHSAEGGQWVVTAAKDEDTGSVFLVMELVGFDCDEHQNHPSMKASRN